MKPKISFVLPTWNRVAWLAECVNSLRGQTVKEIEIIVVDDCSTDTTPQLMDFICKQDDRVKYIRNPQNLGAGLSRNKGNEIAQAPIIGVTDSDDLYPANRAQETLKYFHQHQRVDFMTTSYYEIDYHNKPRLEYKAKLFNLKDFNAGKFYFCHPSAAYYRKDILKMPYKKETEKMTDDFQFVKEWMEAGKKLGVLDKVLCLHRVLPGSIMYKMRGGF